MSHSRYSVKNAVNLLGALSLGLFAYSAAGETGAFADGVCSKIPSYTFRPVITTDLSPTSPSSDWSYRLEAPEVAIHKPTGLEVMRCYIGQTYSNGECTGLPMKMTVQEGFDYMEQNLAPEWRIPNVKELEAIVERCRIGPALNVQVFPISEGTLNLVGSTPTLTSSPVEKDAWGNGNQWFVMYNIVISNLVVEGNPVGMIRPVRDAQ